MFKIRSRFVKEDDIIFISHLDLVRVFERAMRRGNIPISYSKGFNPHPIMAFATALGVGVSSQGEYIDIQLDKEVHTEEFKTTLNAVLPKGLKIIESKYISKDEDSLMSIISRSLYMVKFKITENIDFNVVHAAIDEFLSREEIIEEKEKKIKGRKYDVKIQRKNIRPNIYQMQLLSVEENTVILKMNLATGSVANLKPEVVVKKLKEDSLLPIDVESIRIQRLELYKEVEGQWVTPLDVLKRI
ncbi:TIGR03936 family radical SAM-associated protein [Alkaliphilus serpentinus]|uniref:DUF2344 domain-containing protein n=1 Tax=Alkaliphilus serpentinus TaxID=1482731 RepID=A0A833HQ11_9FIRM|nr:TIGR03936 family radical SAM-associated protein [Alkaliphilus serpentinus]KAB3531432.1 DUF2344 domain-containing protein [Alkaliphilus serpentinus]